MTNLLIRDVDPDLKRRLLDSAKRHGQSLSAEAKALIRRGLQEPKQDRKLGSEMFDLVLPEDRGDDLVFEYPAIVSEPPDFE